MRRTEEPPKTNITLIAASLATVALVIWMTSFAARTDSLYSPAVHAPAASSVHVAATPS